MNARGCACRRESLSARNYREVDVQSCGTCQRCGAPGHTRRAPGPLAKTGAWCDRCFAIVEWRVFPQMLLRAAVMGTVMFGGVVALPALIAGAADVLSALDEEPPDAASVDG